ncbi:MAG: hypothetical protein EBU83_03375 [bacterium]|nr:hypothetical protein [Candidatus Aquidulcis sp.]
MPHADLATLTAHQAEWCCGKSAHFEWT